MSKIKKEKEETKEEPTETVGEAVATDPRLVLWNRHLAKYKIANPVKYAQKEARGEFKKIPDTFKGIVKTSGKGQEIIS